ncbi:hypothetical protein CYMTET_28919 [Cymbomonas tetramitiformis]|uniref:Ricin B lectin domain-containing protein n=1 Tax=Cymbomonas tetramitiformis TaxID=36881 RepID=A0AAE0FLV0_9CHLO|nr:hypothetical protein CYMTET_28919 [Cymbomonas tetramitiformis]
MKFLSLLGFCALILLPFAAATTEFTLKSKEGACLSIGGNGDTGSTIYIKNCDSSNDVQHFTYEESSIIASVKYPGMCLDASERSNTGGLVHLWDCDSNNWNQLWTLTDLGGDFEVKATHGICLDASERTSDGGKIHMWDCDRNNVNQKWLMQSLEETRQYSSCSHLRYRQDEYLDRQSVGDSCSANQPLTGFGLENNGCHGEDMRYKYGCGASVSSFGLVEKTSGCEAMVNKDVEFLDRQDPFCAANEAMTKFTVVGCGGENMEYKFSCVDLGETTAPTTYHSSCEHERGTKLEHLDRLDVECPEGELLNGFVMEGCGGDNMRYRYTCVKELASPPPPSPSSPPPPSPSSPPPPSPSPPPPSPLRPHRLPPPRPHRLPLLPHQWCKAKCLEDPYSCHGVEYYSNKERCDVFTQEITSFTYKKEEKDFTCSVNRELSTVPLTKYRKNGETGKEYVLPEHLEESSSSDTASAAAVSPYIFAIAGFAGAAMIIGIVSYRRRHSDNLSGSTKFSTVFDADSSTQTV